MIKTDIPPIYHKLREAFGVKWGKIIIAYYPDIYCAKEIPEQKLIHEKVHLERQREMGTSFWWERYLDSPTFRLEEELLAYKKEVEWIKAQETSRNLRRHLLNNIFKDLSSGIYGHIISFQQAKEFLT